MTINQFSESSGLTPGTLRFYEHKGVLLPALRTENGYRLYSPDQLQDAYLITSLRQAGIGLEEIRSFLSTTCPAQREQHLDQWRHEIAARLLSLEVAQSYLTGMTGDRRDVHLIQWEHEVRILWFQETVAGGPAPFTGAIRARRKQLQQIGIRVGPGSYVRYLDGLGQAIRVQVGFEIPSTVWRRLAQLPHDACLERFPPTVFAGLNCAFDDAYTQFRVNRFLRDFKLEAVGSPLERHVAGQEDWFLLMIPVKKRISSP